MSCTAHQIFSGDHIQKNEMEGTYRTYCEDERLTQGFGGETLETRIRSTETFKNKGSMYEQQVRYMRYYTTAASK
jgi:hypothetical protein